MLVLFAIALSFSISDVSATEDVSQTTVGCSEEVTFTTSQINTASSKVKTFVEKKNRLPSYVYVGDKQVTMPKFLALMTEDVKAINNGKNAAITQRNVKNPNSPSESIKSGSITKTEYITIANRINNFVDKYERAPNFTSTSLGRIRYENLVYTYAKITDFYKINKRLPNTVSIKPWGTSTYEGTPSTVDKILKTASKYGYSGVAHDAAGLIKYGSGDCWAMSDYLYKKFSAAKIKSRIVQYATAYSSNHRSVQLYQNGAWANVPYMKYGFNIMFNCTSGSKYGSVIACYK